MARRQGIPKLRRHKALGRGVVRLNGRDYYLGAWPDGQEGPPPAVQEAYDRKIAEWLAAGRLGAPAAGLTVYELGRHYLQHAQQYYRKEWDGELLLTGEMGVVRCALRYLLALYGPTAASAFGPLALQAIQAKMVTAGLCRRTINSYVRKIKQVFRWGVARELVPTAVLVALQTVRELSRGRTEAAEYPDVGPAPQASVEAVLGRAAAPVPAMIGLQLLTGMRPGELVGLTVEEVDRSRTPWEYRPSHKTEHLGRDREIYFGPQARALLGPLLEQARGHVFRQARSRRPFSVSHYWRKIQEACAAAGVEPWHPHQLRHTKATEVEESHGIEATAAVLGNTVDVAKIYAHAKRQTARRIAEEMG